MSLVSLERDGALAVITLDNPPQNRINERMAAELAEAIGAVEASDSRAVVLRAKGENFSFGGDIVNWPDMPVRQLRALFEQYMAVFNRFERLPVPVVAAVHGLCLGGGLELAIRADMIVAAENARFGHPEQTLGIVTLLGGVYRVAERAGRSFASEWALTSEHIGAATMMQRGVVNRVVPDFRARKEHARAGNARGRRCHPSVRCPQGSAADLGGGGCRRGRHSNVRHCNAVVRNRRRSARHPLGRQRVESRAATPSPGLPGALTTSGSSWNQMNLRSERYHDEYARHS